MKLKIKKRSLMTVLLAGMCAGLIGTSAAMISGAVAKAQTTSNMTSATNVIIPELTLSDYGTRSDGAVFSGTALSQLYDALTGTNDGTATYKKVKNTIVGSTHPNVSYGGQISTTLPAYKTAQDLYTMNSNKNILVDFGGQTWTVTFLTTDMNGDVIATLWLADAQKDSGGNYVRSSFSWYDKSSSPANWTASASSYASTMYSSSKIRVNALNGGDVNGTPTVYATGGATNANSTGTVTVSSADRVANDWAIFTLNNSALASDATKANKSLVDYIDTPSQLKYTYYEDFSYQYVSSGYAANYYAPNDALNKLNGSNTISTAVGTKQWYNANIAAIANTNYTGPIQYNDWGNDYVWLPSWVETGWLSSSAVGLGSTTTDWCKGFWGMIWANNNSTGTTGQTKCMDGSGATVTWTSVTDASPYFWLRTGNGVSTYPASYLATCGARFNALTARTLAVRPALHLNLTSAAQAAVTGASATDGYELPTPAGAIQEKYDGNAQWLTEFAAILSSGSPKYNWIDTDLHCDSSIVSIYEIKYTPKDSSGAAGTQQTLATPSTSSVQHAGVYTVTLELAPGYKWRNQALVANDATSRRYTFTITLDQLDLKYDLKFYDQSGNVQTTNKAEYNGSAVTGVKLVESGTTIAGANKPSVTMYYLGTSTGNSYGSGLNGGKGDTTPPTNAGTYSSTFTDTVTESDYKLVPNTSGGTSLTFQITPAQVTLPYINETTKTYNANTQTYNITNYNKTIVKVVGASVTAKEGGSTKNYTLTYDSTTGTYWNQSGTGGKYEITINDSASIPKVEFTDAGEYKLEFGLVDTTNSQWASGVPTDKTADFTVNRAVITVDFSAPGTTGFSWKIGDTGNIAVSKIDGNQGSDVVKVVVSWYKDDNRTPADLYTTGFPDNDMFDITDFTSTGTYYLRAKLADDSSDANGGVNRNYTINSSDTLISEDETYVKQCEVTAGSASLDDVKWQYQAGATGVPATITSSTVITYDKVGSAAVQYTVKAIGLPDYCEDVGYSDNVKTEAGTYTATVTIQIKSDKRTDNKMPNPSDGYNYGGYGTNYQYINDFTCTIDLSWTIDKKEIDLSGMPFYYSNTYDDSTGAEIWAKYDSTNPPESSGLNTKAKIDISDYVDGVTGATFIAGTDMKGPGKIWFDFEFTLDSNHKSDSGSNTVAYSMDLTGKQIKVQWQYVKLLKTDGSGDEWKSNTNVPFMYYQLKLDAATEALIKLYLVYEYWTDEPSNGGTLIGTGDLALQQIINATPSGMGACDNPVTVYTRPVLVGVPQKGGVDEYVLKFSSSGGEEYKKTTIGDNKDPVDLNAGTLTSITYGNPNGDVITDAYTVTVQANGQPLNINWYTVNIHDSKGNDLGLASAVDLSKLDAGDYELVFKIVSTYEDDYVFTDEKLPFKVKPVELVVPTLKDGVTLTFNGLDQSLKQHLQNWNDTYMEFAGNSVDEAYHAGGYTAVIKIKDAYKGNYVFADPSATAATTKKPVKALADGEVTAPQVSGDGATATLPWTINKYVLDTTQKSAWNFKSNGASLSFKGVPSGIKNLTLGSDPSLVIHIGYFDLDGNFLEEAELKGGKKFQVAAYLDPDCADAKDVVFKNAEPNPQVGTDTTPLMSYTVPKSGMAAALGNVKEALTKTYFGLPLWAWLLIALALLILLIIIIVVAKKRHKTKEEREAKKAAKEEEKQRREEERRLQQEKLEAERELARAKQEAELEKIRAQAQAGMAGAGMATMAMAQPQQAQQPVQQVVDNTNNELIKEMREQMAEMRAENRAAREQLRSMQYQQSMPAPMYQPQPVQYAQPAPAAAPAAGSDLMTLMDLKVQMAEMKSAQAIAEIKTAQAIADAKGANKDDNRQYSQNYPNYGGYPSVNMGYGMQQMPAPQAIMTPYGILPAPQQVMTPYGMMPAYSYPPVAMLPQPAYTQAPAKKEEEEPVVTSTSQTTPSMTMSQPPYCPPGAVMTTTTTIDTSKIDTSKIDAKTESGTKSSDVRRTAADSADEMTFDIDGFYDPLD